MRPDSVKLKNFDNYLPPSVSNTSRKVISHAEINGWQEAYTGNSEKKVAILLATYQGQKYLAEQLTSFAAQSHQNWELWVSDDGSSDETTKILQAYKSKFSFDQINIGSGPRSGFVNNFLSLTSNPQISADYYAYSDQDDIWEKEKLARALEWLSSMPKNIPALYCGRTRLIDKSNNDIGFSPLFNKPPSFANALMQNIGGGNTMVFNQAARDLLRKTIDFVPGVSHDWWAYILVSGCGGNVFYDATPTVRYRQHDTNLVGMNSSWLARFKRIRMLFQGRFKRWNDSNISALQSIQHLLTPTNRQLLNEFAIARQQGLLKRLWQMKRVGVYRQTLLGNLGLLVATVFGKV